MKYRNWSIGERLGVGLGLLLLTLAVLVAAVFTWHAESAREQQIFTERIAPLAERAQELERALLYVAIDLRSYLLVSGPQQQEKYREAVVAARRALARLREYPKDADGERLFDALEAQVQRYLADADALVATDPDAAGRAAAAAKLGTTREIAAASAREFAGLQDEKASSALATMARARKRVSDGIIVGSIVALLFCFALAYFTAQSIRRPTRDLLKLAAGLTSGDLGPALAWNAEVAKPTDATPRNEMVHLAQAFGAAAAALQRRERRLEAHHGVATALAANLERDKVADGVLQAIVQHLGAEVGVVYWNEAGQLVPIATHAVPRGTPIAMGEGIPGEAARTGRAVVSRDIPRDSAFTVKLGYDAAPPRAVAAIPIVFQNELLAVVLVATLKDFDDEALSFLRAASAEIGIGFQNAKAYEEIARLLDEMREKNDRIQAQNQSLQAQNEEIQTQHEEIQAQHEEIQAQAEELQSQNDQLRQHSDELRVRATALAEADERKNEFLGFLAHELRNPMSAIANSLFILKRVEHGSPRAANAQAIMERQARHLTRLIDDLLDTTRISRGKIELERRPVELLGVVRECAADHQSLLEARRIALKIEAPERELWVNGDRTRLCQVLGNLLSNAIKFSDDGQPIVVSVGVDDAAGLCELRVIDGGCGIDPGLLPELFKPFSQGTTSLARTKGGLGLGLALVKTLVELHGGAVHAQSEGRGRGAQFIVRLPVTDAPAHTETRTAVRAARQWRVLIIEDNRDAAESLRASVELQGHEVEMAHDGVDCCERARRFRPHVVLCDLGLPHVDGYEVARRLRADPALGPLHLVALSGYASPHDRAAAAAAGFDRHVAKPIGMDALEALLAELEVEPPAAPSSG